MAKKKLETTYEGKKNGKSYKIIYDVAWRAWLINSTHRRYFLYVDGKYIKDFPTKKAALDSI